MAVLTLKLPDDDARRLAREARLQGQTKSAYVRGLIAERLQTTDDLLRLAEERWGRGLDLKQR